MADFDYIAICDPVCVQRSGHNLVAAFRYFHYLSSSSDAIEIFAGRSLVTGDENVYGTAQIPVKLNKHFSHYYSRVIPVQLNEQDHIGAQLIRASAKEAHELAKDAAIKELQEVMAKAKIHHRAALFFPSVDYYSLCAIVELAKQSIPEPLHIFIRFIGVMENTFYSQNSSESLVSLLQQLAAVTQLNSNLRFSYSAESKALATRLESVLNQDVIITPTLVDEHLMPDSKSEIFTLCFPGSARIDKGFDRIASILTHIDDHFPFLDYQVYLQSLPRPEIVHHYNIKRTLFKNARINAYPASVSQSILEEYIQKSHVVVMPYCPKTYKERSSAMMAESACYGRQIVASSNCGFSDQVDELGIGITCSTDQEMAEAIINYALMDRDKLSKRADRARNNYLSFSRTSYSLYFTPRP